MLFYQNRKLETFLKNQRCTFLTQIQQNMFFLFGAYKKNGLSDVMIFVYCILTDGRLGQYVQFFIPRVLFCFLS